MHPSNGGGENGYYEETVFWQEFGNSLFVFLNTEEPLGSPRISGNQLNWLNSTLKMTGFVHKFVFFHRPICGTTRSGTIAADYPEDSRLLDDIFSSSNVSVAFAGHNHYYCYNTTASGMTYVITGGAGAPLYSTTSALGVVKHSSHHYLVVNVTGAEVNVTMVDIDGVVRHTFLEYGNAQAMPWDVNDDDYVGIDDIVLVAEHFGEDQDFPDWNTLYDINSDGYVGIDDIVSVADHFGEYL
jgi:hypothetical protein